MYFESFFQMPVEAPAEDLLTKLKGYLDSVAIRIGCKFAEMLYLLDLFSVSYLVEGGVFRHHNDVITSTRILLACSFCLELMCAIAYRLIKWRKTRPIFKHFINANWMVSAILGCLVSIAVFFNCLLIIFFMINDRRVIPMNIAICVNYSSFIFLYPVLRMVSSRHSLIWYKSFTRKHILILAQNNQSPIIGNVPSLGPAPHIDAQIMFVNSRSLPPSMRMNDYQGEPKVQIQKVRHDSSRNDGTGQESSSPCSNLEQTSQDGGAIQGYEESGLRTDQTCSNEYMFYMRRFRVDQKEKKSQQRLAGMDKTPDDSPLKSRRREHKIEWTPIKAKSHQDPVMAHQSLEKSPPIPPTGPPITPKISPIHSIFPPIPPKSSPGQSGGPPIPPKGSPIHSICPPIPPKSSPGQSGGPPIPPKGSPIQSSGPPIPPKSSPISQSGPPIPPKMPPIPVPAPPIPPKSFPMPQASQTLPANPTLNEDPSLSDNNQMNDLSEETEDHCVNIVIDKPNIYYAKLWEH